MSGLTPDPIADRRHSYDRDTLDESRAAAEPYAQFKSWIGDALAADLREPNAMTLATVDTSGNPRARIVLLRGWSETGFVFYTNYFSTKGREIAKHPRAALLFFWDKLERQVRIDGDINMVGELESDLYFARRPRGHQLSAWASPQSEVVPNRADLEGRMEEVERRFAGTDVPRPPHWGGYRVSAYRFEFWQGRPNRVHDRLEYKYDDRYSLWTRARLAP